MYRLLIKRNGSTGFVVGTLSELQSLAQQPGVEVVPNPYNPDLTLVRQFDPTEQQFS